MTTSSQAKSRSAPLYSRLDFAFGDGALQGGRRDAHETEDVGFGIGRPTPKEYLDESRLILAGECFRCASIGHVLESRNGLLGLPRQEMARFRSGLKVSFRAFAGSTPRLPADFVHDFAQNGS